MQQKRKQTLQAGAGLLTALTLSVGLLAGCNPASFNPGPGAPTAPSVPSTNAPAEFDTLAGLASLNGAALANAEIKVFNALTGAPAQVVAADGGNVVAPGAGNFAVQGDSLKTDAQGNFNLKLAGLTPGSVAQVVVSADGKALSALVTGDGATSAYNVQAVTFQLNVNEVSTAINALAAGMLKIAANLQSGARTPIIRDLMTDLEALKPELATQFQDDPNAGDDLSRGFFSDRAQAFFADNTNRMFQRFGVTDKVTAAIQKAVDTVATQVANRQVEGNVDLAGANFVGTNLTIKIEGNKITIGDKVIDLTPTLPNNPIIDPILPVEVPPIEVPVEQQSATGAVRIVENAKFSPTITVRETQTIVSQTAGQDDIKEIFGRIKKTDTTGDVTTLGVNTGSEVNLTNVGVKTLGFTAGATSSAPSVRVPGEFGGAQVGPTQAKRSGHLTITGTGNIATFTVYELGDYYILYTAYGLSDSVQYTGGHTTTVNYSNLMLGSGKTFETVLRSRLNSGVFVRNSVQ